jgi:hypothetical protein
MLLVLLVAAQAASPAPDIALDVRVQARELRIEQRGQASLELRASPDGGTTQTVDKPQANGRRRLRNVDVRVQAEARIADPAQAVPVTETGSPQ